jgi:hypothetical protein
MTWTPGRVGSMRPYVVITDPMIHAGPFRVLARVDGAFAVIDERLSPGLRTVAVFSLVEHIGELPDASTAAKLAAKAECERRGARVPSEAAA